MKMLNDKASSSPLLHDEIMSWESCNDKNHRLPAGAPVKFRTSTRLQENYSGELYVL